MLCVTQRVVIKMDTKIYDLLTYLQKANSIDWIKGLRCACIDNNIDMIKLIIKHGSNDLNQQLLYMCHYGYTDMVRLLIEKGATSLTRGLYEACYRGHIQIVKLLMEKGAVNLCRGMQEACLGNHMNIVALMLEKGVVLICELTIKQKQQILDIGINTALVIHDREFEMLINQQHKFVEQVAIIADEILHDIYKNKQCYDKNVISLIAKYIMY